MSWNVSVWLLDSSWNVKKKEFSVLIFCE
ncbi:hypothetical protein F383_38849 [Gossypium arboreum]|uniref:Uncharacterized protein n=1 Tax=Gossypium arboreum TaxID=29729 RepID=A0A0B0MKZ7_GOSAR|nr:hypothetical protein F383_38849 [Gossypium arboreum]